MCFGRIEVHLVNQKCDVVKHVSEQGLVVSG